MKLKKITLFILSIFSFSLLIAQEKLNTTFSTWDSDADGLIEKHEFVETFVDKYFHVWGEENNRGMLKENFFKKSYAGLDSDNDNYLSDEEWIIGYNYFYKDYVFDKETYIVDANGDGKIDYDEYYSVVYDTKYFSDIDFDQDNYISEYELAEYVFNNWDINDSGTLSTSEYSRFDWYYLDV